MSSLISTVSGLLPVIELVLAILIVGAVLLQTRGAAVGGAFTDTTGGTYYKRRGSERFLFRATIVLGVAFALTTLAAFIIT